MAGTDFSHLTNDELLNGIKALNIPDYIRTKSYGVDVRETLAQMAEMLMQLALNQGMDPQQAQEFVYRINNKIDKGNVTMSDLTQEVKEALTGGAVAVVGVNAVGTENIIDGAVKSSKIGKGEVTAENTDFITKTDDFRGINKLNPSNSTEGGYYDVSTLNWVVSSAFSQSEFIPCKSGDVIGFSEVRSAGGTLVGSYVVFKNINGEIFSGINRFGNTLSVTVPNDAVSFSTNYRNEYANTLMVTLNEPVPDSYVPYGSLEFADERLLRSISEYVLSQTSPSIYKSRFKSVNFIGDSITWGYSPYDGTRLPTIWPDLVAEALGIDTIRNYGISGSTLGSLSDESRNPMVNRFTGYPEADLTIVLGGRNDWNFGVPLGTIDDDTKFTYYGALNIMMDGLITKSPNSAIVFLTPLHGSDSTNHATKGDIIAYRNAVIEVGAKHSIPVYDLYGMSGIYPENSTSMTALMPDGRHPNIAGHEKIAHGITGFLKNI